MAVNLQMRVWQALDNAMGNDYGEFVRAASTLDVANDIIACDADLEDEDVAVVAEHVQSWRRNLRG